LDGAFDKMKVTAWFLIGAQFSTFLVDLIDDMSSFVDLDFSASEVIFVYLFIYGGVVTVSFALVSTLLHPYHFTLL